MFINILCIENNIDTNCQYYNEAFQKILILKEQTLKNEENLFVFQKCKTNERIYFYMRFQSIRFENNEKMHNLFDTILNSGFILFIETQKNNVWTNYFTQSYIDKQKISKKNIHQKFYDKTTESLIYFLLPEDNNYN